MTFHQSHTISTANESAVEPVTTGFAETPRNNCAEDVGIPSYLHDVYEWAYLTPSYADFLDHDWVVNAILLGNSERLQRALLSEIRSGMRVLQAAHVYGDLIPKMAAVIGETGHIDVIDVVPLQAAYCQKKLKSAPQACVHIADVKDFKGNEYDIVSSFFLLHELPDDWKRSVVDNLLSQVAPSGRAIFIDYHGPAKWNPVRYILRPLLAWLEPFANALWTNDIKNFASRPEDFRWKTETLFGGLYQKTVVTRM